MENLVLFRSIETEYYGDQTRWFVATVINSSPPPGLEGRVRIRIHGIHDPYTGNVSESDLPWANVAIPLTEGGSSGIGKIPQVLPGAFVYGVFMDGKSSQTPLILGSLNKIEFPTEVQVRSSKDKTLSVFKSDYDPERKVDIITEEITDDRLASTTVGIRRSQCMRFFIDNGYTPRQAAGITGCLEATSAFETYNDDEPNLQFFGIAKWDKNGTRYRNLITFATQIQKRSSIKRFSIQLQYVLYELRTLFSNVNAKLLRSELIDGTGGSVDIISRLYLKNRFIAGGNPSIFKMIDDRKRNESIKLATKAYNEVTV
jgi:hypothetical protein